MTFTAEVNFSLEIGEQHFRVAEHPHAPGIPFGQEGRAAIVYQILDADGATFALKVFKPAYRKASLAGQVPKLEQFSDSPGLKVCKRIVLSLLSHGDLIKQHPDLLYAVVMPWIQGATWHDVIAQKQPLTLEQSLFLARALARMLTEMEECGIAHCDISAANVLLPGLESTSGNGFAVELVDVEQLYTSAMQRPDPLIAGTPGYLPKDVTGDALWNANGDRFAGAVLLAEMLGWCDERVRTAAHEGSYFQQDEMQTDSQRYRTLLTVLQERWGLEIAKRFSLAWKSQSLVECPLFGDWLVNLPGAVSEYQTTATVIPEIDDSIFEAEKDSASSEGSTQSSESPSSVDDLIALAHKYEQQGDWDGAIKIYRQVLDILPPENRLAREIQGIIRGLEHKSAKGSKRPSKMSKGWLLGFGVTIIAVTVFLTTRSGQFALLPPVTSTAETQTIVTDTPHSTNTALPKPTNTLRPTNTATAMAMPISTRTPTLTPTPDCDFEGVFANVWCQYRSRLGCPIGQAETVNDAEQLFENGHMLWRRDTRWGYVLYEKGMLQGTFQVFEDEKWLDIPFTQVRIAALRRKYSPLDDDVPSYSCTASPPPDKYQPIRGFGKMWCEMSDPVNTIGWALAHESGFGPGNADPMIQDFERGTIFRDSDGTMNRKVYILFDDGTFVRIGY